jgi:hypothetical protein
VASAENITIDVKVSIPDETVCRCLRVLEMWMDDNPGKNIIVERVAGLDAWHHQIHIEDKELPKESVKIRQSQKGGENGIT